MGNKWNIDTSYEHKTSCPRCRRNGRDVAGNNLHVYGNDSGAFCWSCSWTLPSKEHMEQMGWDDESEEEVSTREKITPEENEKIKSYTGTDCKGWRGIRKETNAFFGVRYEYSEETGEPIKMYVPTTINGELAGYRTRVFPKDFGNPIGQIGKEVDMIGEFRFKNHARTCIITGGETKLLLTYQMMNDYRLERGKDDYESTAVVCSTLGENGAFKQVQTRYEFFNQFTKIVICMDADEAGEEAAQKIAKVLPKGKAFIMKMRYKDADIYVENGKEKEFIDDFWKAKQYTPDGIVASSELGKKVREAAAMMKIPLPPFMHELQAMMAGGIPLRVIINLASASGCVDKDTEYLTPQGWKKFNTYSVGDKVAQYHEDGSMTFTEPLEYVKRPCKVMTRIANRSTDQVLSDEHRFVYYATKQSKKPRILPFSEVKERHEGNDTGFRGFIATCFTYDGEGVNLTEGELRLQVAVMADGRIVQEGANNYTQMRFRKERKYRRLIAMCEKFNLAYRDNGLRGLTGRDQGKEEYEVIVFPKLQDKSFDAKYYNCTKEQLEIICDEVMHWDGTFKTGIYTSTRRGDVDFLQFAFATTGKRAVVGEDARTEKYNGGYCGVLNVNKGSQFVSISAPTKEEKTVFTQYETLDGFKYCFMVETGMLVLRRNGRIFITGNTGKSTIVDEMMYYWIFNSPYKIGVVTLESDSGQWGTKILSRHIQQKIDLIESVEDKLTLLDSPEVLEKENELYFNEDGTPRFYLIEERDGGIDSLKELIMNLIISCDCKVIILDPLQDILDGLSNEEQSVFMRWMKGMIKSHDVTFINVNHVRKSSGSQKANSTGADMHEEDIHGSGSILKSGACNLLFRRDKETEDPIERNTTYMKASKIRWTGKTGVAGEYYYDNETHTLHDKKDWYASKGTQSF